MATHNSPYGDIFVAGTPAIDRLSQQLYTEQKERDLERKNQVIAMDNEFSKNVANIRDADVGDIAKLYGDWKAAAQASMKQKGGVSPQEQLEILRKKAEMYKALNESKAFKEREEFRAKRYVSKPDDFTDEAGDYITKGRSLPMSQLRQYKIKDKDGKETVVDLTNDENLLYQDKTNWQPILQKAAGTLAQRGTPFEEDTPDKLQKKITSYKALNSPVEYYNSIVGTFANAKADENFAKRYAFTPQEAQTITEEYNRVLKENPTMKQVYGELNFPSTSDLLPGHQTAKLLAMQHAIHNQPTADKPVFKDNKDAIMTRQEQFKKDQQKRQDEYTMKHIATSWGYRMEAGKNLQETVDNNYDADKEYSLTHNGDVPTTPAKIKTLTGREGGSLKMNGNGDYIWKHGDKEEVIPAEQAKVKMMVVQKPAFVPGVNSASKDKNNNYQPVQPVLTHSRAEFLKAGWTEDQINKALKAGKIKVN